MDPTEGRTRRPLLMTGMALALWRDAAAVWRSEHHHRNAQLVREEAARVACVLACWSTWKQKAMERAEEGFGEQLRLWEARLLAPRWARWMQFWRCR